MGAATVLVLLFAVSPPSSDGQVRFSSANPTAAKAPVGCADGSLALVLSGGGAPGLVHVGVIKALDALGIRPDLVVGSSMGALVGAMYAAGYTGEEIEALVLSLPLTMAFPGYRPALPEPLEELPVLLVFRGQRGKRLSPFLPLGQQSIIEWSLRRSLVSRDPSFGEDFSSLILPFHAVATDMESGQSVTLSSGDLVRAVLASSALPVLLPPVIIDDRPLVDGSISQNIPVQAARRVGASRVLVSDATSRIEEGALDPDCQLDVVLALLAKLFNQGPPDLKEGDVIVHHTLPGYSKLDFSVKQRRRLIQLGFQTAMEALRAAPCLPRAPDQQRWGRLPIRAMVDPRSAEPGRLRAFEDAAWMGGNSRGEGEGVEVGYRSGPASGEPSHAVRSRNRPPRKEFWDGSEALGEEDSEEWRFVAFGMGYRHGSGGSAWVGWVEPAILGGRGTGSALFYAGSRAQGLELGLWASLHSDSLLRPFLSVVGERRTVPLFGGNGEEAGFLEARSFSVTSGPELNLNRLWTLRGGLYLTGWSNPDDGSLFTTAGGKVLLQRGSPDQVFLRLEASGANHYSRLAAEGRWPIRIGSTLLTTYVRLIRGSNLPLHLRQPLGGAEGFPGLHLGEGRGDRENLVGMRMDQPFLGPLRLRLDVASGSVRGAGVSLPDQKWILGVRAGIGIDTPFGPIDVGYGRTNTGRGSLFVAAGGYR